jgi:hypothetical protein
MIAETRQPEHHPLLRYAAAFVSYLFHPLFIPVYVITFMVYSTSYFPAYTGEGKLLLLLRFFVMYSVFPLVTVLLAKALGFVQSVQLKERKDRIIPYVACGVYYFWMWYVLRNQAESPSQIVDLSLAIFIASSAGLIVNSFFKVSMHAISLGLASTFILILGFSNYLNFGPYITASIFITGLVCTARLIHSDHSTKEVYLGLLIGVLSQVIASL